MERFQFLKISENTPLIKAINLKGWELKMSICVFVLGKGSPKNNHNSKT